MHAPRAQSAATQGNAWLRIARRYAIAALGCLVFAFVYAQFSHEVHSPFMSWMFAIPLLAGALPSLAAHILGTGEPALLPRQLWALGLATFTVASCLRGIFEIAGTGSVWLWAYVPIGVCLAAGSFASTLLAPEREAWPESKQS